MLMEKERRQIVLYGKKMVTAHLTIGAGGNLSILDRDTGLMAISPSGLDYYETEPEDIVILRMDGSIAEGSRKPSSESALHIALYQKKPEISSVMHTHSMFCIVLSALNMPIKAVSYLLADAGTFEVPVAPYHTYGTMELADAVTDTIGEGNACLMANHGLVTCGKSIASAFSLAEECEFVSEIQWRSLCIGNPSVLNEEQMKIVMQKFGTYGQGK